MEQEPSTFEWVVMPVKAMTMTSRHKIVRAAGEVVSHTIMLPWMVLALFGGAMVAVAFDAAKWLRRWWERV